jgi:hypothetical protein
VLKRIKNITGNRFGRIVAVAFAGTRDGHAMWECRCDCGRIVIIGSNLLLNGHTKSCGCLRKEHTRKHGQTRTRLFNIWRGMHQRCTDQNKSNYKYYGARGISVCHEWNEFAPFKDWADAHGYDEALTIDRIDPNGNYEPSNCRWISIEDQQRNRRNSKNRKNGLIQRCIELRLREPQNDVSRDT